jgi:hypothetical protein
MSDWVHALPSLQTVPFATIGLVQAPEVGSQSPGAWHGSSATHVTGVVPTHVPDAHASTRVQALPSLQDAPSGTVGFEQAPVAGSHVPAA